MERALIHRMPEMSDNNSGEKHAGGTQADAAKFQTAQRHSEHTYKGERTDRMRNGLCLVKFEKPVHRLLETTSLFCVRQSTGHWFYSTMQRAARAFQQR